MTPARLRPDRGWVKREAFTTREVGQLLGRSPKTVRRWIREGRLKARKGPGGQYLISRRELKQLGVDPEDLDLAEDLALRGSPSPPPAPPAQASDLLRELVLRLWTQMGGLQTQLEELNKKVEELRQLRGG